MYAWEFWQQRDPSSSHRNYSRQKQNRFFSLYSWLQSRHFIWHSLRTSGTKKRGDLKRERSFCLLCSVSLVSGSRLCLSLAIVCMAFGTSFTRFTLLVESARSALTQ